MKVNTVFNFVGPDLPAGASAGQRLSDAVKCATLAVPLEAWQPWQFQLGDGQVELSAHAGRASVADDSLERELLIHCGAALFHLKLALKQFGCLGRVELFPDLAQTGLVARIRSGSGQADAYETALFAAMALGENQITPLNEAPVDESFLAMFQEPLVGEKAWLEFSQSESSRNRLVALAASRAGIQRPVPPDPSRVAQWAKPLLAFVVRGGESGKLRVEAGGQRADNLAALAVIKTKTDDKHGWLAAGQAMAQARLLARASEISSQVFDAAFRDRRVREDLRTSIGHKGFVQAIIGFGSESAQSLHAPMMPVPSDHDFESNTGFFSRSRFH